MLNILSYIGVSLQSELCMWTLLGLIRTIFDATLFKVNANLKQVWQMSMPEQLSMPVQRAMRTIISGVMLVQCFTVYVYLAAYIVLLYPVFLEERPNLVLPWLLLAAIRKFLCELTCLALGLGACLLLGAARPPCIKFVVFKVASITPAFYMWMLVFSYYHVLKVASTYKRFPTTLTMVPSDHDGLELAVRRRRTKSLQDETQLRKKLVASFNGARSPSLIKPLKPDVTARMAHSTHADFEDIQTELLEAFSLTPFAAEPVGSDTMAYEEWCGSEIIVPRGTDRILEQFALMMLRIAACINADPTKLFSSHSHDQENINTIGCSNPWHGADADSLPLVSTTGKTVSYLQNYPQIFMKKAADNVQIQNESILNSSQPPNIENVKESSSINNERNLPIEESNAERNRLIEGQYYKSTRPSENATNAAYLENVTKVKDNNAAAKTKNLQMQTNVRYNIESNQNIHEKSKSDSELLDKKRRYEEKAKEIKQATEETYNSRKNSRHAIEQNTSIQTTESGENLELIRQRIKINAALQLQQQRNDTDTEQETNDPTSTQCLRKTKSQNK